jgi:EAL domain-containing protein (putative c-di-GMP-specific phosphodiesterase class I)
MARRWETSSCSRAAFDTAANRGPQRPSRQQELRDLIEQGLLPINYQPVVDLVTGGIRGFEALTRWPESAMSISPLEVVAVAEETGIIGELGMHVLRTALEALADWREGGLLAPEAWMSVNISHGQLEDPQFAARVRVAIAGTNLPADLLRLEITERTLMRDPDRMAAVAEELSASGALIQLDDFGSGHSSLSTLHRFPIDALKIDRSFVSALTRGTDGDDLIVRCAIALGHSLGCT